MFQKSVFSTIALTCIMCMSLYAEDENHPTNPENQDRLETPDNPEGQNSLETQDSPVSQPTLESQESPESQDTYSYCGTSPRPMRVTARHIEGKGVGYNQGYTTVEGFFSPIEPWDDAWVPFIDLRGHVFNNGKMASNVGLGVRYLTSARIWGANAYYDYRKTTHQHYNQFALGFESLGKIWDFRLNGYLPLGTTKSSYYHTRFDKFKGHHMYVSRKREFALKGANFEVGAHVDSVENFPFYFAAGPYCLAGQGHQTWGGELRAAVDIFEYVRIEGNTSYDNIFKWIGQGQLSINIPFGGKRQVTQNENSCSRALALSRRAVQRVDRNEIIPVDTQRQTSKAIDPATGQPYFFIFVNNTSHSLGTFESPFPTLLQAQNASSPNDVIYVYPGDGTTTGMASGITLQNGQMLLGASVAHNLGTITIPPMASTLPSITNTTNPVVTLANNNTVSGFLINTHTLNQSGIVGTSIANLTATQNTFATTTTDTNGIFLTNPTGQVLIDSSTFIRAANLTSVFNGNGIYVLLNNGGTLDTLKILGSTFTNINNPGGMEGGNGILADFENSGGTITHFTVSGSTFNGISSNAIGVAVFQNVSGSTLTNFAISESNFSNINGGTGAAVFHDAAGTTLTNFTVSESNFSNLSGGTGVAVFHNFAGSTTANFNVTASTFSNLSFSGFGGSRGVEASVFASGNTIMSFTVTGSTFTNIADTSIGIDIPSSGSGSIPTMNLSDNTFTGPGATANGYAATININAGTTCLEFTNNTATPVNTPVPYQFNQTGGGTFNRTIGSDNSTNTGQFSTSGTVNPPGSCTH